MPATPATEDLMAEELELAQQQLAGVVEDKRLLEEQQLRNAERIAELEQETTRLFDQVRALELHYEERDAERANLLAQVESLKKPQEEGPEDANRDAISSEEVQGLREQIAVLIRDKEGLTDRVTALEAERVELIRRADDSQQSARESAQAFEDQTSQVAERSAELAKIQTDTAALAAEKTAIERDAGHIRSQLEQTEARVVEADKEIQTLRDENAGLLARLSEFETTET